MRIDWRYALLFLIVFGILHAAYTVARGSPVERFLIDSMTVRPAAAALDLLNPTEHVRADGPRLKWRSGSLSILNGCEGTEILFLLWSAILAFPAPAGKRLRGMLLAAGLVWMLNQGRIIGLYFALRHDRELFSALHGYLAPALLIVAAASIFAWWLRHAAPERDAAA